MGKACSKGKIRTLGESAKGVKPMKKRNASKLLLLIVAGAFLLQNCATIIKLGSTNQKVPVTSNPIGARIIVDGKEMGYTPLTLKLRSNKNHLIRVEKQGYDSLEIRINRKVSGPSLAFSILGNALLLGVYGGAAVSESVREALATPFIAWWLPEHEQREAMNRAGTTLILSLFLGSAAGVLADTLTGAYF